MVLCFIALPVFAILGIFSATYRNLAYQSFRCVFLKATFQPCDVGLDVQMKTQIVSPLLRLNKSLGKFVYRYFELLSWAFVLISFVTLLLVAQGGYNYYLYGNCNGPNADGFCVFDPTGEHAKTSSLDSAQCNEGNFDTSQLTLDFYDSSPFAQIGEGEPIIFVGCFSCNYTRKAYDVYSEFSNGNYNFTFVHVPIRKEDELSSKYANCLLQENEDAYWNLTHELFTAPYGSAQNATYLAQSTAQYGLEVCVESTEAQELLDLQLSIIRSMGIYGTPTVFVNEEPVVGPKPLRVYKRFLK